MKKHIVIPALFLFLALIVSSSLFSQSPQGIPYQAVMRNADGSVMASSAVSLTFMIHDGTANGAVVYQESHTLTSNAQGLVSCVVGNGVVLQGNFSNINWGNGAKFLQVTMGSIDLGTQQMLSVPYALYAENVGVRASATGDTLVIGNNSIIVLGVSAANHASITIGQDYQGGKVAYIFQPGDLGYVEGETHGLIAAAQDLLGFYQWGCFDMAIVGAEGFIIGTGAQNTLDMVNTGCCGTADNFCNYSFSSGGAALACSDLILDGYDDWFLPSIQELTVMYENRTAIGGFQDYWYWSSSEYDSIFAWLFQFFDYPNEPFDPAGSYNGDKFNTFAVRPIRIF